MAEGAMVILVLSSSQYATEKQWERVSWGKRAESDAGIYSVTEGDNGSWTGYLTSCKLRKYHVDN